MLCLSPVTTFWPGFCFTVYLNPRLQKQQHFDLVSQWPFIDCGYEVAGNVVWGGMKREKMHIKKLKSFAQGLSKVLSFKIHQRMTVIDIGSNLTI